MKKCPKEYKLSQKKISNFLPKWRNFRQTWSHWRPAKAFFTFASETRSHFVAIRNRACKRFSRHKESILNAVVVVVTTKRLRIKIGRISINKNWIFFCSFGSCHCCCRCCRCCRCCHCCHCCCCRARTISLLSSRSGHEIL